MSTTVAYELLSAFVSALPLQVHAWVAVQVVTDAGVAGFWINAADLVVGDVVSTADGGTGIVSAVTVSGGVFEGDTWAYNLTIADTHTYYVGDEPLLVHNTGTACPVFNKDQQAVIALAKAAAKRGSVSHADAKTLVDWALEVGLRRSHYPAVHTNRSGWASTNLHINVGPVKHIPVR